MNLPTISTGALQQLAAIASPNYVAKARDFAAQATQQKDAYLRMRVSLLACENYVEAVLDDATLIEEWFKQSALAQTAKIRGERAYIMRNRARILRTAQVLGELYDRALKEKEFQAHEKIDDQEFLVLKNEEGVEIFTLIHEVRFSYGGNGTIYKIYSLTRELFLALKVANYKPPELLESPEEALKREKENSAREKSLTQEMELLKTFNPENFEGIQRRPYHFIQLALNEASICLQGRVNIIAYVTDLYPLKDLNSWLEKSSDQLTPYEVVAAAKKIVKIVQYMWEKNWIHPDLSQGNILCYEKDSKVGFTVIDWYHLRYESNPFHPKMKMDECTHCYTTQQDTSNILTAYTDKKEKEFFAALRKQLMYSLGINIYHVCSLNGDWFPYATINYKYKYDYPDPASKFNYRPLRYLNNHALILMLAKMTDLNPERRIAMDAAFFKAWEDL